jgi:hypothetical protein
MNNQNQYIEEEQTTQWSTEKVQKNKQRSTKHTYKTKDRLRRVVHRVVFAEIVATSQHGTQNVKTHNRTTQKLKR